MTENGPGVCPNPIVAGILVRLVGGPPAAGR